MNQRRVSLKIQLTSMKTTDLGGSSSTMTIIAKMTSTEKDSLGFYQRQLRKMVSKEKVISSHTTAIATTTLTNDLCLIRDNSF